MADGDTSEPLPSLPGGEGGELDALIREGGAEGSFDLDALNARPLDLGEKADDAIDYEDISDDDLADDETGGDGVGGAVQPPSGQQAQADGFLEGIFGEAKQEGEDEDMDMDMDDLFGDAGDDDQLLPTFDDLPDVTQLEPTENGVKKQDTIKALSEVDGDDDDDDDLIAEETPPAGQGLAGLEELDLDEEQNKDYMLQQALFAQSGMQTHLPDNQVDNDRELLKLLAPKFSRDEIPRWHEIFPPRRVNFDHKFPTRPPKPIRPTKVNLDIDQDQRTLFNSALSQVKRASDADPTGFISTKNPDRKGSLSDDEDLGPDADANETLPGHITEQDLAILCADWDTLTKSDVSEDAPDVSIRDADDFDSLEDEFDFMPQRPAKKRKTGLDPQDIVSSYLYHVPPFDDPEDMVSRIAKRVVLDLNDPHLLLEKVDPTQLARAQTTSAVESNKTIKEKLAARFNHSNDAEYDMLKQNHQNKIRSTLGNLAVDHSVPAIRLQYPYYKVKMNTDEARGFHRRQAVFKPFFPVVLNKASKIKRKHLKGKKVNEIFSKTADLPFSDNSIALLLEYSEEYPMMMSQIGMGARVINYYRKRNKEDNSRPKGDIGESAVLLPEDKSPFYIFGHIDPGDTVVALYNSMYRAPVFEHKNQSTDFLLVRTATGMHGQSWYLRKADHICAVGQQFPSVDVPGPHSRKVTTASKNRLKMISFRIIRKRKYHRLRVEDVTKHFPDTTDMQNRQKMKEFLTFNRDFKEWEMRSSEQVPEEDVLQGYVRPEDVCLLESMQVGQQYLHDAGIQDDNDEDDDNKEGQNLEQQLAPWHTSRNFLNATQGKAMLQLHGEGDPSGRGEAFSFIRTSMKGGFKALGESITDKIATMKELGGHSYNVARQQKAYEDSIRRIWDAQKAALSSSMDHSSDVEMDDGVEAEEEAVNSFSKPTPRSEAHTPAPWDETRSQITSVSNVSQTGNMVLRIRRTVKRNGQYEEVEEIIKDPAVIRQYKRRKTQEEAARVALSDIKPTGDAEYDARTRKRLEDELARLEKNRERRVAREKAKGKQPSGDAMSPGSPDTPTTGPGVGTGKVAGTQRKCANCGQVGHIKTNKKLCPLLNGTMKQENAFTDPVTFMGAPPTL